MSDLASAPRARLVTAFGTVLYVDAESGELRHGEFGSSPANAVFVADPDSAAPPRRGWLMHDSDGASEQVVCLRDRSICLSRSQSEGGSASPTVLELIPLERGLIAFKAGTVFLSAVPGGQIRLAAPGCSTWELFVASEDWCSDAAAIGDPWTANKGGAKFEAKQINSYIVHPLIRVAANARPKARKVLIYGYTKWSHGRVYYDLCKHLHPLGYIVDILDWQTNHTAHIKRFLSYYDLFATALDGVPILADIYGVPYDRMVGIAHHELEIRMLIERKGIDVFDKLASYGVVSEFVYCASLMRGVPRIPMVASLGINYADFHSDIPERLATVGYASSMSVKTYGVEWKRGDLAEAAAREAGLAFKVAGWTGNQISFHDMPEFYRSVDAVVTSSISEAAQLPVMEAAAAGRLVIGTPVGHFPQKAYQGGGILAPIEAEKFKTFTAETLRYYKDNPAAYVDKCRSIQEAARKFDWQYAIGDWVAVIEAAYARSPFSAPPDSERISSDVSFREPAAAKSSHALASSDMLTPIGSQQLLKPPGISFIVRVRNEEKTLAQSLASLRGLTCAHEIVVVLHRCTDRSKEIAQTFEGVRIFEYDRVISRPGFETLVTPDTSTHSLISYYNWCFSKVGRLWCFKWDADFIATNELVDFLNAHTWNDPTPTRIMIPTINADGIPASEPYLFNAGHQYSKWVFWEHNKSLFGPGVTEKTISPTIVHSSTVVDAHMKSYWRENPWFDLSDTEEAMVLRQKYSALVRLVGPEPKGLARDQNPIRDKVLLLVRSKEAELKTEGISLWS